MRIAISKGRLRIALSVSLAVAVGCRPAPPPDRSPGQGEDHVSWGPGARNPAVHRLILQGHEAVKQGDYDAALEAFNEAIRIDPGRATSTPSPGPRKRSSPVSRCG